MINLGSIGSVFVVLGVLVLTHACANTRLRPRYGIQHMVNVLVEADAIYRTTEFNGMTGLGFVVNSAIVYVPESLLSSMLLLSLCLILSWLGLSL